MRQQSKNYQYQIDIWEEDVNGNNVLVSAFANHYGFRKGDRDKWGAQLEPDENEWLEVVNYLFNGKYLDEKETEALLGYDWDVLENKIIEKFYEEY